MGCHTWAYRKIKADELEKAKTSIIANIKDDIRYVPKNVNVEKHINDVYNELLQLYDGNENEMDYSKKELANDVKENYKTLQKVVENLENAKTAEEIAKLMIDEKLYRFYHNVEYHAHGDGLYVECGFDVPVRVYGYPEESFTDAEKFIEWLKEYDSTGTRVIMYTDDGVKKGFSEGFNEEMEKAIRDFWEKYDNEVYVEFG